MDESTKIADLTVAEFRALMQECFDADRKALIQRENEKFARLQEASFQGIGNFYQGLSSNGFQDAIRPLNPAEQGQHEWVINLANNPAK